MLRLVVVFNSGVIQVIVTESEEGFDFDEDMVDYYAEMSKIDWLWHKDELTGARVFIRCQDVSFIKATEIPKSDWDLRSPEARQNLYGTAA